MSNKINSTDTQSEHEIIITRVLNAPRDLVFKAWTDPEHIVQWWGPRGFKTRVDQMDFQPGGTWRYVMIGLDGTEYPSKGVFSEIVPPSKIVSSDEFDEGCEKVINADLPSEMETTTIFEDLSGKTKVTIKIVLKSAEDRRKLENMGVVAGWNESFDCLEEFLAKT